MTRTTTETKAKPKKATASKKPAKRTTVKRASECDDCGTGHAHAAVMFQSDGKFYIMATRSTPPAVHAFPNSILAVRYFEDGYRRAHELGGGYSAGACIAWIQLQPRVFEFHDVKDLQALTGKMVRAVTLSSSAVIGMVAFEVTNVKRGKAVYDKGIGPRLTG